MISVIIPVYKAENYISECIESILSQSYSDFELILVDDGSPDRCGIICDEYARKDSRVKVVHKKNEGVSAARNEGLDKAAGDWVLFIDADDKVASNYFDDLISLTEEGLETCLVVCGSSRIDRDDGKEMWRTQFNNAVYSIVNIGKSGGLKEVDHLLIYGTVCGKLYNLRLINRFCIRFNAHLSLNEDHLFYFEYLSHLTTIVSSDRIGYFYMYDKRSVSLSTTYKHPCLERLTAYLSLKESYERLLSIWNVDKLAFMETTSFICSIYISALKACYGGKTPLRGRMEVLSQMDRKDVLKYYRPKTKEGLLFKGMAFLPKIVMDFLLKKFLK